MKDKNEIKRDPFFKDIDWDRLLKKGYPPPPLDEFSDDDEDDDVIRPLNNSFLICFGNLKGQRAVHVDFDYDEKNKKANRVTGFTFIRKQST